MKDHYPEYPRDKKCPRYTTKFPIGTKVKWNRDEPSPSNVGYIIEAETVQNEYRNNVEWDQPPMVPVRREDGMIDGWPVRSVQVHPDAVKEQKQKEIETEIIVI